MPELTQAETVASAILILCILACIGWAVLGLILNISRETSMYFCVSNLFSSIGFALALFRPQNIDFLHYFQGQNWTDVMMLGSAMMVNSGLRTLHGLWCASVRSQIIFATFIVSIVLWGQQFKLENFVTIGIICGSAWYTFLAFSSTNKTMLPHYTRTTRWMLLWPLAALGLMLSFRIIDDSMTLLTLNGEMRQSKKIEFLDAFILATLLTTTLLNASLIGLTLNHLFKKLNEQASKLHDQANRLQHILDTAPVGVAISSGGKIRFANPQVTKMLNMKTGDESSNALVWPEERPKIIQQLKKDGSVTNMEIQMYCPKKSVRDLLVTYLPTDYEGQVGILGWMIDITERKEADRAIRQINDEQSAIFESASIGIAFIKNQKVARANLRVEELFGWEPGSMQGQSPQIWWNETTLTNDSHYPEIERGEIHYSTHELKRKDGSRFWCRMSGSAIDVGDLSRGTVWMFDDITAEREAVDLMREAKEMAEEATKMKSNFLANMSHEIRTPMNAIIGMSHLALKTDLTPKQRNYIEKADTAAHNLLVIINDILDFSKIEAGKLHFEQREFYLEDVLENLSDITAVKAQEKGLELLFDIGPDVPTALIGDSMRLGQVMLNLLGNAIKFTESGEITLGIHLNQPDRDQQQAKANLAAATGVMTSDVIDANAACTSEISLRFDITDTGVGLTVEQQQKLFSAFSQADASTTRKYGGTGLGLTICKRLVELMNGEIGVKSQIGVGSTFYFTAQLGVQLKQPEVAVLDQDVMDLRILVVDDNARAREIMLAILTSQKFDATAVASGFEAITELKAAQEANRAYSLVLMDWIMPELDGLAAIQQIRADPTLKDIPAFVVITARSRDELLEQADSNKIDGLLQKPVCPSALLDTILCTLGKEKVTRGRKQQRRAANRQAEENLRGAYLLLVEDNPVNQELALDILQDAGLRIDVADNGAIALDMLDKNPYEGILMDCQMPVMDGFEATRKIRADSRFTTLPILAMTANTMNGDREMCLAAGMNDHIGKPIDVDQLFIALNHWIPFSPNRQFNTTSEAENTGNAGTRTMLWEHDLPDIPCLDLELAMRRMGENAKLMNKLIYRFIETQAEAMTRIRTALDNEDIASASREAHSIKGLAGNIGATHLQTCASTLEMVLKHQETRQIAPSFEAMTQALDIVIGQITNALGIIPTAINTNTPSAEDCTETQQRLRLELVESLQQLTELLSADDTRSAKIAENIAEPLRILGQGSAAAQLIKLISKYEFEEALAKLTVIAQTLNIPIQP